MFVPRSPGPAPSFSLFRFRSSHILPFPCQPPLSLRCNTHLTLCDESSHSPLSFKKSGIPVCVPPLNFFFFFFRDYSSKHNQVWLRPPFYSSYPDAIQSQYVSIFLKSLFRNSTEYPSASLSESPGLPGSHIFLFSEAPSPASQTYAPVFSHDSYPPSASASDPGVRGTETTVPFSPPAP